MIWALLFACSDSPPPASAPSEAEAERVNVADPCHLEGPQEGPPVILLVSMDTARADGFSVYGTDSADTPVVDALAGCGVRFDEALAHAPTTLNSHTTMLSGLDPHGHGVVRNGYQLSDDLPLLQERLSSAGWETVAVVGSGALESSMGLSRGFDIYDDRMSSRSVFPYEDRANGVTQRALAAVDQRTDLDRPLFLFVHYYDPHLPWDSAPAEVRARFADPDYNGPITYARDDLTAMEQAFIEGGLTQADLQQARQLYHAELHWTDQQLGILLEGLDARGLGANRLTVVTSDHGESIGDWPAEIFIMADGGPYIKIPIGHGDDVGRGNIHVPLVWMGRGSLAVPTAQVVDEPVGLMDLSPTILELAGLPTDLGEGRSLVGYWSGTPPDPAPHFAEATKPKRAERADAWNNLGFDRRVTWSGVVYRDIPWIPRGPLITDLMGQTTQVSDELRRELAGLLSDWDDRAPAWRPKEMTSATEEALEALGYIED